MATIFKVDSDIKQDFLESKPTGTAHSNTFVLKLVDEHESLINKEVYNMSYSELREMIAMQFKNSTIGTISKNISILRLYVDFCINKNLVKHMENRLATFTRKEIREFVSKQAIEYKYISLQELRRYQNMLENEQDRALLESPFIGIRGRTVEEGTLEELINLQMDEKSVDFKNNLLKLVKNNGDIRYLEITDESKQILLEGYKATHYIGMNGEVSEKLRGGIRKTPINTISNHVFRIPGKNKNELFNSILVNSRMHRIQDWIGNKYITIHSLYMSGMITMAKEMLAEKGELASDDYIQICEKYDYGSGNPQKYWITLKDAVAQYI